MPGRDQLDNETAFDGDINMDAGEPTIGQVDAEFLD